MARVMGDASQHRSARHFQQIGSSRKRAPAVQCGVALSCFVNSLLPCGCD
jgi:hypothetical protein